MNVTVDDLKALYHEVTGSSNLIEFTKTVRRADTGAFDHSVKVKRVALENLFSNKNVWNKEKTGNGHAKYTCKLIPGLHVGFPAHGDDDVFGEILESILTNVQEIINVARNDVFKINRWESTKDKKQSNDKTFDFDQAVKNHKKLYPNLRISNSNSKSK